MKKENSLYVSHRCAQNDWKRQIQHYWRWCRTWIYLVGGEVNVKVFFLRIRAICWWWYSYPLEQSGLNGSNYAEPLVTVVAVETDWEVVILAHFGYLDGNLWILTITNHLRQHINQNYLTKLSFFSSFWLKSISTREGPMIDTVETIVVHRRRHRKTTLMLSLGSGETISSELFTCILWPLKTALYRLQGCQLDRPSSPGK